MDWADRENDQVKNDGQKLMKSKGSHQSRVKSRPVESDSKLWALKNWKKSHQNGQRFVCSKKSRAEDCRV